MEIGEALKRVDSDAASIALRETICGVGLRSNKTIMRFRRAVKQVTETAKTQTRFREIESVLEDQYSFIPREVFQDLLELQRVELYPDGVRQRALELLLLVMQQKRPTYYFAEELVTLPAAERQLFLRELYLFQQYGWPSNVTKLESSRKSTDRSSRVTDLVESTEALSHTFRELLRELLRVRPSLLHDVFDVFQFISVFLGQPSSQRDSKNPNTNLELGTSLLQLFDHMNSDINKARLNEWKLPSVPQDILDFVITGSVELQHSISLSILQTLRRCLLESAESKDDIAIFLGCKSTETFLSDRNPKTNGVDPPVTPSFHRRCISVDSSTTTPTSHSEAPSAVRVLPPLWFAAHLILRSQYAFNAFMEGGALEVFKQLWNTMDGSYLPGNSSNNTTTTVDDVRGVCCLIVGVISARNPFESLFEQLHSGDHKWFYALFRTFASHFEMINSFRAQIRTDNPLNDRQTMYDLLLRDLSEDPELVVEDIRWNVLFMELHDRREVHFVNAMIRLDSGELVQKTLRRILNAAQVTNTMSLPKALKLSSLVWLMNELIQQQPESLVGVVDVKLAASMFGSMKQIPTSPHGALSIFLLQHRHQQRQASQFIGYGGHELGKDLQYFIHYLGIVPTEELKVVVTYIVDSLISAAPSSPTATDNQILLESESQENTSLENDLVPFLQLLEFAAFLAALVPASVPLLLEANIIHTTLELCANSTRLFSSVQVDGFTGTSIMAKDLLHIQSLLLLGSLASSCMDQVVDEVKRDSHWSYYPTLFVEAAIKTQLSLAFPSIGTIPSIRRLITNTMDSFPLYFLEVSNDSDILLSTMTKSLSLFGSDLAFTGKMTVSREIMKFISLAPRQSWSLVFNQNVLTHPSLHHCVQFIIREFLGCKSEDELQLGKEDKMYLIRLWRCSNEYGFHESHPVDRFVHLVYHIGNRLQWFTTWYSRLSDIGITELCDQLTNKRYDLEDIAESGSLWTGNMTHSRALTLRERRRDFFEAKLAPFSNRASALATDRGYETKTLFPSTEYQHNKEKTKPRLVLHSTTDGDSKGS